jgi:uncharacterized membrane protein YkvA (DUF1232 family)
MNNNNNIVKYEKEYSEKGLMDKITSVGKKMGVKLIYVCLILAYTLKNPAVPMKIKATIISALGYVIAPIDLIFDGIPGIGYTDDIASVMFAFGLITMYITPEIKQQAKDKMKDIFGETIIMELEAIDVEINNQK